MTRLSVRADTLRALFARSGNQCAFPGCAAILINEKNYFVGQVCHIEAAEAGGSRYNPAQTDEERRAYDNLILLCYPHHIETDEVSLYPASRMKEIKHAHEALFLKNNFKIDETLLYKIADEMQVYWSRIEQRHAFEHLTDTLAMPVKAKDSFFEVLADVHGEVRRLDFLADSLRQSDDELYGDLLKVLDVLGVPRTSLDEHKVLQRAFLFRNWEVINLGLGNVAKFIRLRLVQLEIKYLEEYLKLNASDAVARDRMTRLQREFEVLATTAIHVD